MDKYETQYYLLYRFLLSDDPADHAPWWDWVHEHEDTLPLEVFWHLSRDEVNPTCILRLSQIQHYEQSRGYLETLYYCPFFRDFLDLGDDTNRYPDIIRDKLCLLPSSRLTLQERAKLLLCSYGLGDDFEAIGPFLDLVREHPEVVSDIFREHLNHKGACYLTSRGRDEIGVSEPVYATPFASFRGCHMAQSFLFDGSYDSMWRDHAYVGRIGDLRQQLWQKGGAV